MRILIATIGFGSGHNKAADAMAERVEGVFTGAEIRVIDFLRWKSGRWDTLTSFIYFTAIKYIPSGYHALYTRMSSSKALHGLIFRTYIRKMDQYLKEYPADIIISTHVFCAKASDVLRKKYPHIRKVWGVLTDFMDDRYWNTMQLDQFFVATEELKSRLVEKGVLADTITVAPMPVRRDFFIKKGRVEAARSIPVDPHMFTVLILGGGNGLGGLYEAARCLLDLPVQILAVSGVNRRLKEDLERLKSKHPNLFVFGFIENVYDLMDATDVCVTKPGGITIAECMAKEIPIFIYGRPLPGPETENIDYLVRNGFSEFYADPQALRTGVLNRLRGYRTPIA